MIVLVAPQAGDRRRDAGRPSLVAVAHVRLMILMLLFVFANLLVVAKLGWLAVSAEPATSRDAAAALVPLRGDIVDRNGAPLARTIDAWSIGVQPDNVIGDKVLLAERLAELMPERDAAAYFRLLNAPVRFTYLKHRAMPELVSAVNALGDPGITFAREPERLYPQSALGAQLLGYLNSQRSGVRGMEKVLDAQLNDPVERSKPAALSVDLRVQAALENELGRAMTAFQAAGAAGVILDVHTGEVMAMSSLPSFNPNKVQSGEGGILNNVTQSVYELGSAFKPIAMAAAIDSGTVTSMARRFDATAPLQVGRFKIKDDHAQNRWLNIPETLIHSSNIATARIADEMGQEKLSAAFRRLGFDTAPDIEIEKARPLWPKFWARTTTMTTAYGHGIAVTPLHLANAYATLVNGGIWRPATLMKVDPSHAAKGRRVFSESTSARMRQLLRVIVTDGTGKKAEAPGFRVGGKTGTAEKPSAGGYNRNVNVSTFAAAFPMDAPRYVVIAMLDSSKRVAENSFQTTAAYTAAPVVSRVITRAGPLLGVQPSMNRDVDLSEIKSLLWHAPGDKAPAAE
ncbi:cell division protein FtsI (penicillin-binding protein 3) [Sphingomonas guangdongensis]|uniref:Cell division protein FtsI (Penicillin-binding protein 3) n=1 Tax=Sphingomonas guangdongensis TaxID=1141890 RepID=A0A285QY65_9SPHN|nr:penicillin-binding protein 2 [Sphingomonas guangdongensis]SOB86863.1 cell division protein FtsI (penicillin-binding protein 3) [Sphingomonas guangdongensis]